MPDQEPEEAAVRPETALGKQLVADQVTHLKKVLADQVKTTQVKVPAVHQVIVPGKTLEEVQDQKLVEIPVNPVEVAQAAHPVEAVQAAHRAAVPVVDQEQALAVRVEAAQAVHPEEAQAVSVVAAQAVHPVVHPVSHPRIRPYRMTLKKRKTLPDW